MGDSGYWRFIRQTAAEVSTWPAWKLGTTNVRAARRSSMDTQDQVGRITFGPHVERDGHPRLTYWASDVNPVVKQLTKELADLRRSLMAVLVMDLGYTDDNPPEHGHHPLLHQFAWSQATKGMDASTVRADVERLVQQMKDESPAKEQ